MDESSRPVFAGGHNIALKVPPHLFQPTVAFYRDVLGLRPLDVEGTGACFEFGPARLWVDRVEALSQAELWLELHTPDAHRAAAWLGAAGVVRRDEIEPLPADLEGFWIQSPAAIIHLVAERDKEESGGD